jgi:hypothetical protein
LAKVVLWIGKSNRILNPGVGNFGLIARNTNYQDEHKVMGWHGKFTLLGVQNFLDWHKQYKNLRFFGYRLLIDIFH